MFYLTTHSTHLYLRLYGVRHRVNNHSDRERGNPLPQHMLLFPISRIVLLYAPFHRQNNTFVTPVVGHWLEREIVVYMETNG